MGRPMAWICTSTEFRLIRSMLFPAWVGQVAWRPAKWRCQVPDLRPTSARLSPRYNRLMGLDYPKETAQSKARSLFFTLDGILTGFIGSYVSIRFRKAECLSSRGPK